MLSMYTIWPCHLHALLQTKSLEQLSTHAGIEVKWLFRVTSAPEEEGSQADWDASPRPIH